MDLKEAIIHAQQVAEGCPGGNRDCAYQHDKLVDLLEELQRYRDLEEQGRLMVLPCKIGDSVDNKRYNWFGTVEEISINSDGVFLYVVSGGYNHLVKPDEVEFR